ncbi:hypothetical protein RLOatenuis_5810 [Rickettsiales bacterium]|nr:hypothetical protein RLOatenuis_5810 [Rickettsiales bacterium]
MPPRLDRQRSQSEPDISSLGSMPQTPETLLDEVDGGSLSFRNFVERPLLQVSRAIKSDETDPERMWKGILKILGKSKVKLTD